MGGDFGANITFSDATKFEAISPTDPSLRDDSQTANASDLVTRNICTEATGWLQTICEHMPNYWVWWASGGVLVLRFAPREFDTMLKVSHRVTCVIE